jgi:predicted RNase H-like HicB family nuclease
VKVRDLLKLIENDGWRIVRSEAVTASTSMRSRRDELRSPVTPETMCMLVPSRVFSARLDERETMIKYAIVIEQGENLSAYVPDLPGCISTGRTIEEIERNIREAIELHLEGLREDGEPIPDPQTAVAYVELQKVG